MTKIMSYYLLLLLIFLLPACHENDPSPKPQEPVCYLKCSVEKKIEDGTVCHKTVYDSVVNYIDSLWIYASIVAFYEAEYDDSNICQVELVPCNINFATYTGNVQCFYS